ncbi:MAG: hypothetical protein SPL78_06650 [Bacteroidales bacterium]|nr:hypothetical protein [Bacteroidales bacterium]
MIHLFFDRKGSEILATCVYSSGIYCSSAFDSHPMPVFLFASAQGHGDVHVLHAFHQVELRENRLPVLEYLLLGAA